MRTEYQTMTISQTIGQGTAILVEHFREMAVQVTVDGGTYQLKGTINDSEWLDVGSAISADTIVQVSGTLRRLRLDCTANSSGGATSTFVGKSSRLR